MKSCRIEIKMAKDFSVETVGAEISLRAAKRIWDEATLKLVKAGLRFKASHAHKTR